MGGCIERNGELIYGGAQTAPKATYHSKCLDLWYGPTEELVGLYLSRYWARES